MAWHTQPAPWQTLASYSAMFSTLTGQIALCVTIDTEPPN